MILMSVKQVYHEGESDHVPLMAVVAGELFHTVDGFDCVGF